MDNGLRVAVRRSPTDPTVRPARLLPTVVDESGAFGLEAGGGLRAITSGLRVVTSPNGGIVAAEDRFPLPPQTTTALPERLGGGFLFVIASSIWRADRWLGPARPIFTSYQTIQSIIPGLDRVYVRAQNAMLAIDGRTGEVLDLGPWPAGPQVTSYAAVDGWRAAAVTDLRGVVATFDAGATWRPLDLPLEPKLAVVSSDTIAIGGFEQGRAEAWYELRADGSVARAGGPPRDLKTKLLPTPPPRSASPSILAPFSPAAPPAPPRPATPQTEPAAEDFAVKTFGKRPLASAIEDGWPLGDGSAVIARDGALARVQLASGALVELVRDAFPMQPARCHPVPLPRATFGFVCGEPRGTTVIYRFDVARGRLVERKRFDKPRTVASSGNGGLAVRGACAEDADPPALEAAPIETKDVKAAGARPASAVHPYCVLGLDETWREIHVRGDAALERVVVLSDGRVAVVSPPQALGAPARLTVLASGRTSTVAIVFPAVPPDVARMLRLGLWLDGFEERRPGVIGGFLEAGGAVLGIEVNLDGSAAAGQFVRDAGSVFVSGRYGFGWTGSRRGYETTDGGMSWKPLDLPDPLVTGAKVERRACGPIGCMASGWLRVGWDEVPPQKHLPGTTPTPHQPATKLAVPQLHLTCEPLAPSPPPVPPRKSATTPVATPTPRRASAPVLASFTGLSELLPFYHQAPPAMRDGERGLNVNVDMRESGERLASVGQLAKVYGWGPKTGEWETLGRWQVKWLSPFAGWPEIHTSLATLPPPVIVDMTRSPYGSGYSSFTYSNSTWQLTPGDDPAHALLIGKRQVRGEPVLFELEADRAPVEVKRADGEPFGEIEGVVRAAGLWFVATPPVPGPVGPATTIWQIDGGVARELVRVPRAIADIASAAAFSAFPRARLARRSDGRAIGMVVDGQPTAERAIAVRWVLPIDLESGAPGEPEPLGYADLGGVTLDTCADDAASWLFDTSLPSTSARLQIGSASGSLNNLHARLRLTKGRACVERLAGSYDGQSAERAAALARPGAPRTARTGELLVTVTSAQARYPLKCVVPRPPP
jgi:hypothetical protein